MFTLSCMFNPHSNPVYLELLACTLLVLCGFILPFFYFKIFIHLKKSKIRTHTSNNFCQNNALDSTLRLSNGLFLSVIFFCIAYLSYLLFILAKTYENTFSKIFYKYLFLFARSNSLLNPVIYATTNSLFIKAYERIFPLCFPKIKPENVIKEQYSKKKTKERRAKDPVNEQELEELN